VSSAQSGRLKKTLTDKEQSFVLAEDEQHINVFSYGNLEKELREVGFDVYARPRSTTLFGGPLIDRFKSIFAILILFDCLFDLLSIPQIGWNIVLFSKKTPK
jgi:hypothetical protein